MSMKQANRVWQFLATHSKTVTITHPVSGHDHDAEQDSSRRTTASVNAASNRTAVTVHGTSQDTTTTPKHMSIPVRLFPAAVFCVHHAWATNLHTSRVVQSQVKDRLLTQPMLKWDCTCCSPGFSGSRHDHDNTTAGTSNEILENLADCDVCRLLFWLEIQINSFNSIFSCFYSVLRRINDGGTEVSLNGEIALC